MIVVAGEALVDVITRRDGSIDTVPGGGPFNTARAIGRLGVPVALGGRPVRRRARGVDGRSLAADGVSLDLVQRTDLPTTQAFAELDHHGEAHYRFDVDDTSAPALDAGTLLAALPSDVAALHVGTLGLVFEPIAAAIEALVERPGRRRDPGRRSELPAIGHRRRVGLPRAPRPHPRPRGRREGLDRRPGVPRGRPVAPVVVVTDAGGPVRVRLGDQEHEVAVPAVEVVDTVGAGDTFGGAMLAWLVHAGVPGRRAEPDAVLPAVRFGIRAASIVCQRPGADPPTLAELGGW